MSAFGTSFGAGPAHNPNNDVEIVSPPSDGVSSLSFSPVANHVVATSWSGQVLCWEIQLSPTIQQGSPSVASIPKAAIQLDKPVLCSAWQPDGSTVFIGGCDNTAKMWNLATNQQQQVAAHSEPVRHCLWVPQHNMLVTGSWDKTLKYWDLRSPNPVHTHQLPERCYGLSSSGNIMVAATAERHIQIFNLANPQTPWKTEMSPLKFQTRCVACFPDAKGYLLGSVEGRVAVQYVDDPPPPAKGDSFTFKCHRSTTDIYAVNGISFHPRFGTFATCGSDGGYTFWDKDSKQRLKGFTCGSVPISCGAFNKDGDVYAYASSYDWSRGSAEYNPATSKNHILLHRTPDTEIMRKSRQPGLSTRR